MKTTATGFVEIGLGDTRLRVPAGTTVAAALAQQPPGCTRRSVSGQWRAPLCGMGVCHECRVLVNGRERLACQTVCEDGMRVQTSGAQPGGAPCP